MGDRKTDNLLRFENQIALVVGAAHERRFFCQDIAHRLRSVIEAAFECKPRLVAGEMPDENVEGVEIGDRPVVVDEDR